jgi:hypothetical protein
VTSSADRSDEIAHHAERIFAGRTAVAETARRGRPRIGVAELVQFLSDPQRSLSLDEQRALFTNPQLRADYRRLKSELTVSQIPMQAAASSGELSSRRFDGGTVNIHRSRRPGQVYVVFRFSRKDPFPCAIIVENAGGELEKRPLPTPDENGVAMLLLDVNKISDASFLQLISDPTSTGSFVP